MKRFLRVVTPYTLLALGLALALPSPARAQGTVVGWGQNDDGQTTTPAGLVGVTQVAAGGHHTVALRSDGTVVAWGRNFSGQATIPAGLVGVTQVAAGRLHTVALRSDGTVVAWGDNFEGQLNVPSGLTGVVQIATTISHTVALQGDGTVAAWGDNSTGQTNVPAGLTDVVQVAAGAFHSVALRSDGAIVAWGNNSAGQLNVPAGLTDVVQIAGGIDHTVALKSDGTVVAWGENIHGQATIPAGLTDVVQVAAGGFHSVALKSDGTVVAWGSNVHGQATIPAGLVGVTNVAAGGFHMVAVVDIPLVADAGADQTVVAGQTVTLDGSGSTDPDGDPLSYAWTLTGPGSPALSDATAVGPTFCAAEAGLYTATLTVSDGTDSDSDDVDIVAQSPSQTLTDLAAAVMAFGADGTPNAGQTNALTRKLDHARRLLDRGQTSEALGVLSGFRSQVLDFEAAGLLSPSEAAELLAGADAVTGVIDSPCSPEAVTAEGAAARSAGSGEPGAFAGRGEMVAAPEVLALPAAYPNPTSGRSMLLFGLPEAGPVRVAVYALTGREVAVAFEGTLGAGWHEVTLDVSALASGLYVVRATAGTEAAVRRLAVLR